MPSRSFLAAALLALPLAFAGCLGATEEDSVEPAVVATEAMATLAVPVSHEGFFGSPVTACPVVVCVSASVFGATERWFPQDATGHFDAVELNMTWTPSSPLMESLSLGVVVCANECASQDDVSLMEFAFGPSPLSLSLADVTVAEGEEMYVYASMPGRTPLVYTAVATPQAFQIEGVMLRALGASAAEASDATEA